MEMTEKSGMLHITLERPVSHKDSFASISHFLQIKKKYIYTLIYSLYNLLTKNIFNYEICVFVLEK